MANVLLIVVLLAVVGLAAGYVIRAKRRGQKCIGCSCGRDCGRGEGSACSGCCALKQNSGT